MLVVQARASYHSQFFNRSLSNSNEFTPWIRVLMREAPSRPNLLLMIPAANAVALGMKFPTHELWDKLKP